MIRSGSIILFALIYPALILAQDLPAGYDALSKMQQQIWMDKKLAATDPGYSNIKGTPLIFEKFQNGSLYFSNKTFITDRFINYNCYTDEVLFSDNRNIYKANSQDIDYFTLTSGDNSAILLFKQVFLSSEKKRIFMQVLYQGKSVLFKRYRKEFLKADIGQPYGSNRQIDEYNDYSEYYVSINGQEPVIVKPRKSAAVEIFSDKSEMIDDYLKKKKINLKDETDLIRLVEYYDKI